MQQKTKTRIKAGSAVAAAAIAFVGAWEGLQTVAYRDPIGIPTLCYGETRGVKMGMSATKAECDAMLLRGLQDFEAGVMRCTPGLANDTDERVVAFVSLAYNIGTGAYCKSTLARMYNAGQVRGACDQLLRWNRAGGVVWRGLTNRRKAERELCLKGL